MTKLSSNIMERGTGDTDFAGVLGRDMTVFSVTSQRQNNATRSTVLEHCQLCLYINRRDHKSHKTVRGILP